MWLKYCWEGCKFASHVSIYYLQVHVYTKCNYPYEKASFALHLDITDAASPASKAVQSKNIWNESEIKPKLEKEKVINTCDNSKYWYRNAHANSADQDQTAPWFWVRTVCHWLTDIFWGIGRWQNPKFSITYRSLYGGVTRITQEIFFSLFNKNIHCDPSL